MLKTHEFGLLIAILVVVVVTTILDTQHNYLRNPEESVRNLARQTALLGMFSLGAAIVIIAGGIDLSSGSVICFSGTICATIMFVLAPERIGNPALPVGWGIISLAIAGTLVVGVLIGSLHAWLITVVGLPPFVATLATLVGLRSFARAICENVTEAVLGGRSTQINIADTDFRGLATNVWIPTSVFLVLAAACWLLLSRTVVGRHLYALGGNEEAARLSGIRTERVKWLAYCISAVLSSIAGIFYIGDQSVAEPQTLGRGYELNAIAAAVVGGCSLTGGIGTIPGTVLGALFLRTVIDGVSKVIKTGADVYEGLIVGVVVVFAVAFSGFEGAIRRRGFFNGPLGLVMVFNLSLLAGALAALVLPALLAGKTSLDGPLLAGMAGGITLAGLLLIRSALGPRMKRTLGAMLAVLFAAGVIGLDAGLPQYRYNAALRAVRAIGGNVERIGMGVTVDLSGTKIDDSDLKRLAARLRHIVDLESLDLSGTLVTSNGLQSLSALTQLKRLDVRKTPITPIAIRRLQRALPDIEVVQ